MAPEVDVAAVVDGDDAPLSAGEDVRGRAREGEPKYTETNDVNCTVTQSNVANFDQWAEDTQAIVMDESAWFELMDTIEARLVR